MATYRAVQGFSLGEARGDVADEATLVVGTNISEQEAVALLHSGHIATPTTNDTAMTFADWCASRVAETSTPTQWVEVVQGFCPASGVTAAVGDIVLIDEQTAEVWLGQGWVVTPSSHDVTVTTVDGGLHGGTQFNDDDEIVLGDGVRVKTVPYMGSLLVTCALLDGYTLGSITVDAAPVTPTANAYTLTGIIADTAVVATFVAP